MKKINIGFVERRSNYFVSVEKVFRLVEKGLDKTVFAASFRQLPYLNTLTGMIGNLLRFRPDKASDVYHVTGQSHYIALILPPERTVLTIHDIGFIHVKSGLRRWVLKKLLLDLPLRRLKYVTAVSEATKAEIEANVKGVEGKIRVIENPLDENFTASEKSAFNTIEPNILQIGTSPNKNLETLLRALSGMQCRLTIIGHVDEKMKGSLRSSGIKFAVRSELDPDEMRSEYAAADIVAFCSLHEGFGLPIIEAQAMRTPVVTSDLSPMREVAGDGAILVDPYDHASIRDAIEQLAGNTELRERLISNGLANIARFDKTAIAAKYAELYLEIVANRKGK